MYMDMPEAQLYRLYPQHFGQYSQNRFICNVKSLKKTIREDREANALQEEALLHDRALFPKTTTFWGYDRWEGSALQDIDERVDIHSFFISLYYLKAYQTETVMSGWWKLQEKTIRERVWKTLENMHRLKSKKVVFGEFKNDPIFVISVDGVHCADFEREYLFLANG
ncbi:hypothetical protein IV203_022526 [Nitzschia inconspicua]|uniref:Uncharacterized protein n=1 Tax=Nitzschia inconspicua TaxID=303405 RepID=A0A9K3PEJ7_9STRA|nr:hypothetical protein IV203_022526 [Nitzschia inconspicua]